MCKKKLTIRTGSVIHVGVTKGLPSCIVAANSNGMDFGNIIKDIKELGLVDGLVKIPYVQRRLEPGMRLFTVIIIVRNLRHYLFFLLS